MKNDEKAKLFAYFIAENSKLIGYVRNKMTHINKMDAEDIVSDVMLQVLKRVMLTGQIDNLPAYVHRSLQNKVIDYYRREQFMLPAHRPANKKDDLDLIKLLADPAANVLSEVERNEFMRHLVAALDELRPQHRAIFIATEMHGRSFRELAQMWQEPIGTLLSRKCRAVKQLKARLKGFEIDAYTNEQKGSWDDGKN